MLKRCYWCDRGTARAADRGLRRTPSAHHVCAGVRRVRMCPGLGTPAAPHRRLPVFRIRVGSACSGFRGLGKKSPLVCRLLVCDVRVSGCGSRFKGEGQSWAPSTTPSDGALARCRRDTRAFGSLLSINILQEPRKSQWSRLLGQHQ